MHVVAFIFFSAALMLALAVVAQMLTANRVRILEALAGPAIEPEIGPSAEIIYLRPRTATEDGIEWRKAA